ncbi:GbsR/MarR family transcriptional regulator [Capnocytophaga felis]|uniref:HTH marR-type domain-containing protein n=1 Tax=Capnocytophaga felis TaxID=2267611 RepID=A0A5M4B5M6_9FLAO|nr:hypothetical protein [Capnocytophaga felis]GET44849.1 hypothetical protein RCZ01_01510 [Capnocytophaga felis]GET48624.1 hypothetical protein RCZ02_14550 [Capnocytophaga felis]
MIKNVDEALIQQLVNVYTNKGLSPIAAQILTYMKFDFSGEGVTFDQLQEALGVSKGSVSLNLRALIDKGFAIEFNKFNDRKRYFTQNSEYLPGRLKSEIEKLEFEQQTVQKLADLFSKNENTKPEILNTLKVHIELTHKVAEILKESLAKL